MCRKSAPILVNIEALKMHPGSADRFDLFARPFSDWILHVGIPLDLRANKIWHDLLNRANKT